MNIYQKSTHEKENPTRENSQKSARETKIYAREKNGKPPKFGCEKKVGKRKVKKAEKSGREKQILPVKKFKKRPARPLSSITPKRNTVYAYNNNAMHRSVFIFPRENQKCA